MILCDVNVLVYAFRRDIEGHDRYKDWLDGVVDSDASYGVSDFVLGAFLRLVTNPRIFLRPSRMGKALAFAGAFRARRNAVSISPGSRHWSIFERLCREPDVRGDSVPDAWFAALAIESGCEWITADRGFGRFLGLRWRHPLG